MTTIIIPEWAFQLHSLRKSFILNYIEPCLLFILGPFIPEDLRLPPQQQQQLNTTSHRRLGILPSYIEDVSAFRETSMSFASLFMLFFIMACLASVFLSCFYHNQKTSPLFISPRRHRLPKLVPPPLPVDGIFSWIKICFYVSDEEIINRVGFDSMIFIRFHRLALRCIVRMSVFSFAVLLPLNFTGGGRANASDLKGYVGSLLFTDFLRFTMANVTGGSPRLWFHCVAAYVLTGIVTRELLKEYNSYHNIRHRYLLSREPHLRTVLVTNIPKHLRAPQLIENYFRHVHPEAIKAVTICQNLMHLESLVLQRTWVLTQLEKELLLICRGEKRNLVTLNKPGDLRNIALGCCDDVCLATGRQDRLALLYNQLEKFNDEIRQEQQRRYRIMKKLNSLEAKSGFKDIDYILSSSNINDDIFLRRTFTVDAAADERHYVSQERINAKKKKKSVDRARQAIKEYTRSSVRSDFFGRPTADIDDDLLDHTTTEAKIPDSLENHSIEVTDKAFIEMKTFTAATIAIQAMHSSKPGAMIVSHAPEPRDVIWENIYVTHGARKTRSLIADVIIMMLITFYVVPVALVSLLVSDNALVSSSPRIAQLAQASAFFATGIALVQPLCLVGIQQLLPPLFMQISKAEGFLSYSEVQMKALSNFFLFQVLNIFLVTAIAGSIFDTLAIIIENPEKAFELLGNSLPRMSSFFVTFVTMKTFLGLGVELARAFSIIQSILRYICCPFLTLRQRRRVLLGFRPIDDPGWFPFHKILAQDMLVVVISVVFAVIAPIVLLPCALFCLFSRIMWTHQFLYVYESVFESGGEFYPKIFRRFVFGLIIAQMTITGQFILKEARHEAYATIALMFFTYTFLRSTRARYDAQSTVLPLEVATVMDMRCAQEEETRALRNAGNPLKQLFSYDGDTASVASGSSCVSDDDGRAIGPFDPFENAYLQPALRADPQARPEQPCPPAQLGRPDTAAGWTNGPSQLNPVSWSDDKATVQLKSLNQEDRHQLDKWWKDQMKLAGHQRFLNILVGEESGSLRLGKIIRKSDRPN